MSERAAPANVAIRRATVADDGALRAFRCVGDDEPWAVAPELTITLQVPAWIRDGTAHVWVAEEDERLVGVIALTVDNVDTSIAVSQVLAVVADRRRCYIGYQLKRTALEWFAAAGGAFVYSEVDEANAAMRGCNATFGAAEDPAGEPAMLDVVVRLAE